MRQGREGRHVLVIDEVVVAFRAGIVLLYLIEEELEALLADGDIYRSSWGTLTSCKTAGATPPRRAMSWPRLAAACAWVRRAISWPYLHDSASVLPPRNKLCVRPVGF